MQNPDKRICLYIARMLEACGVERAVLSPGSRNVPMVLAIKRRTAIETVTVVDERSAAFIALGMAAVSRRPVALVCTSGSAVLNYAPAVAEAFYRHLPLLVISADRPADLVDQGVPQTIRQHGVLANIVKAQCDVSDLEDYGFASRKVRDAMSAALSPASGPVYINLHLSVPLALPASLALPADARPLEIVAPDEALSTKRARELGGSLASPRKVLIVAGGMDPDPKLNRAMCRLAAKPNITVLAEVQSNLHGPFISNFDTVLGTADKSPFVPDLVITMGGSLVSGRLGAFLGSEACSQTEHWRVGVDAAPIDTFGRLTAWLRLEPRDIMPQLASAVQPFNQTSGYSELWRNASKQCSKAVVSELPWSDAAAMSAILEMMPEAVNLQISNGTAIRYAQIFGTHAHRVDCNRGVSGIDGCTSTTVGASMAYSGVTMLITGDMSAQYDVAALAAPCIPDTFRMVVLNNCGGGIFRCIRQTSELPELEECFAADVRLPLANLCRGYGLRYFPVTSLDELFACFAEFYCAGTPAVMDVETPPDVSAQVYRQLNEIARKP